MDHGSADGERPNKRVRFGGAGVIVYNAEAAPAALQSGNAAAVEPADTATATTAAAVISSTGNQDVDHVQPDATTDTPAAQQQQDEAHGGVHISVAMSDRPLVSMSADDIPMAEAAAAEAARRRRSMRWMTEAEDMALLEELEAAEEDYDEPEELFTTDGIPIEPFHLRRERAEGFFDAEGNYIEYKLEAENDAWLDSLGDGPVTIEPSLAARLAARADDADAAAPSLDDDDAAIYKKRIIDMLQPGENVLQALRRLGGRPAPPGSPGQPTAVTAAHQQQKQRKRQHQQATGATAATAADLPTLAPGQEQQPIAEVDRQHEQSPQRRKALDAVQTSSPQQQQQNDISRTSLATGSQQPQQPAMQQRSPKSKAQQRRWASSSTVSPENRLTFDKLTEYADILLTNGDVNIYTASKEALMGQLDMADLAIMLGEALSPKTGGLNGMAKDAGHSTPAQAAAADDRASNGVVRSAESSKGVQEVDRRRDAVSADTVATATAGQPGAANQEDDVDMFADEVPAQTAAGLPHEQEVQSAAGQAPEMTAAAETARQSKQQHENSVATLASPAGVDAAMTDAASAPGGTAIAAAGAETDTGTAANMMDGFVLDESSGYYYSSELGYYFEPSSGLFGDASSGLWYKYHEETQSYQLVESASV